MCKVLTILSMQRSKMIIGHLVSMPFKVSYLGNISDSDYNRIATFLAKKPLNHSMLSTFISRGGYDDHLRQRDRINLDESHYRFRRSLPSNAKIIDFTKHLENNYNSSIHDLLLHNPKSQVEIVSQINTFTNTTVETWDLSISIAYSWRLKHLDDVSDEICKSLKGLFLFAAMKLSSDSLLKFIARCENISSLTVACMDKMDAIFLTNAFSHELLPKLEFLEVTYASDDTIAAMVSSPKLRTLVFRLPDKAITNAGFHRLVQAGGAKNLMMIQVR